MHSLNTHFTTMIWFVRITKTKVQCVFKITKHEIESTGLSLYHDSAILPFIAYQRQPDNIYKRFV